MIVYTLELVSDGESNVRVFKTEEGRNEALVTEALERFDTDLEKEDWTIDSVRETPAEYINDSTFGETDVYVNEIELED